MMTRSKLCRHIILAILVVMIMTTVQPVELAYAWPLDCTNPANLAAMQIDQAQCESLESFYDNLGGPGWTDSSRWSTATPVGSWWGLIPVAPGAYVMNLDSNDLVGNIQDVDFSGIVTLVGMDLESNMIGGDIGGLDLAYLSELDYLYLNGNQIGGNIESLDLTGMNDLLELNLYFNQIGGNINGLGLSGAPNLARLTLDNNQIGGSIDGLALPGINNLQILSLSDNQIGGNLEGLDLTSTPMMYLYLDGNQIGGDPSQMPIIPNTLRRLHLSNNQINGTVPDLTGNPILPTSGLRLCPNPAINPTGIAAIDNYAEALDLTGWTAASGCGITGLVASAACNGGNLDVTITTGDGPFNITGTSGPNLPQNGVHIGIITLTGPGNWTGVTVTETTDDLESINLGDFNCLAAAAACNGPDLNVTVLAGDPNFDISANDPAAALQTQNNVPPGGPYMLTSSGGYGTWTGITVDELGGDNETATLPDVTCNPPLPVVVGGVSGGGSASSCKVTIDVEADHEVVAPGDRVIWTVRVTNSGLAECQGVQTYGTMPGEFTITDIETSRGNLNWDGGPYYRVELGTLAVNEQVTVSIDSLLQGIAAITLPEGAAGQSAGTQICLTGYITDPVNDTDCVTLFPDTLPSTGGEPVSQSQNWGWMAAAGILIAGLGGYAIRRRTA